MADRQGHRAAGDAAALIIDERFQVQPGMPLPDLAGLACFEAQDRRGISGDVVALRASRTAPPRARLAAFLQVHHEALLSPLAHGPAGSAYWIIVQRPPGASLAALKVPWSGNGLLTHVLRPAALALEQLQASGLTHRAIRPDNVFLAAGGSTVVLGPAWAAPPAYYQPAVFEPPYSMICPPGARGDGSIADDVYALGVLLLALWSGQMPLAGAEARHILALTLEQGSHAALTSGMRLQRGFEDILRAMLSDDPLARPTPDALAKLDGVHPRRGGQRVAVRAARPIAIGERLAWNRRMLALECAEAPAAAISLLRHGAIEHWLRRSAEDNAIASGIEELRREQLLSEARTTGRHIVAPAAGGAPVDPVLLLRLIALLDPLAPLFWLGLWLWPDGLGPLLAGAVLTPAVLEPRQALALLDTLHRDGVLGRWRQMRPSRPQQELSSLPPRLLRRTEPDGGEMTLLRVAYLLNPYLPCNSPALASDIAVTAVMVVAAIERVAGSGGGGGKTLLDPHALAFLEARLEDRPAEGPDAGSDPDPVLRMLRLLARCQALPGCGPMARIAAFLLPQLEPRLRDWPGTGRRERRIEQVRALCARGDLTAVLLLMTDVAARETDEAAREAALAEASAIGAALVELGEALPWNLQAGRAAARDTASAIGMLCMMSVLLYEVLG